jgi:D-serine deaminase-like pyridoxal phosphate-dependent protein
MTGLDPIPTPALLLDIDILEANLERMQEKADQLGVALRPHIKTHKCVEIAERQRELGARGVTVSTLYEARVFAEHGFDDITWAFPLIPSRVQEATRLASEVTLRLVIDSLDAFQLIESTGAPLHVWLKVDCGYHRAGMDPASDDLLLLASRLSDSCNLLFDGLLTHSGQAYSHSSQAELARIAEHERSVMVAAAERLGTAGIEVPGISVGSTPSMSAVADLSGVTEARPGNYALYDLDQVLLGSCAISNCAATVLTTVVSSNMIGGSVIDAGALALSKDLGHSTRDAPSYGRVFSNYEESELAPTQVVSLSQEHGVVDANLAIGSRLRILPNHSCLTVAQFDELVVVRGDEVVDRWKIWRGRS